MTQFPATVAEPGRETTSGDRTLVLNMGPQHPSTHGVLRLVLEIDGETIVRLKPEIGYLHTGIEKTCEAKFYQQVVPLTDRIDYLCPMTNNLAYCLAVEKLLGLEIPPKAQWMRVLMNELTRINSHLVWLGTHAMDLGAMTVFLYCFREREDVLRFFEMVSGQRMMTSYFRIGGLALEPPLGFFEKVKKFADRFPGNVDEYEGLLTGNPIFMMRTKGVAHLSAEDAIALGACGPTLRGSGVDIDLRRDAPYTGYENFKFNVPVRTEGDVFARYLCRVQELRESIGMVQQALAGMPEGPDKSRRAQGRAARPREDEDADGSPHLPLQDHHRGLHGSGGRGLSGDRIAARRDGILHRQRRDGEAVSRAHARTVLRESAGAGQNVRRPTDCRCGRGDWKH